MQAIENSRNPTHRARETDFEKFVGTVDARSTEPGNKHEAHHHDTDESPYLEHEESHVVAVHIGRSTEERRGANRSCNKANAHGHPGDRASPKHVFFKILISARNKETYCHRKQQIRYKDYPIDDCEHSSFLFSS